jgi:hypothetical protein
MLRCMRRIGSMRWRPLPANPGLTNPVQWVGCEQGEDVAWVTQGRRWGEPDYRWTAATRYGTASGWRGTLKEAQQSAEAVLHEHGMDALVEQG